jgi:hypothetical protein
MPTGHRSVPGVQNPAVPGEHDGDGTDADVNQDIAAPSAPSIADSEGHHQQNGLCRRGDHRSRYRPVAECHRGWGGKPTEAPEDNR